MDLVFFLTPRTFDATENLKHFRIKFRCWRDLIASEDNLNAPSLSREMVKRDLVLGSQTQNLQLLYFVYLSICAPNISPKQPSRYPKQLPMTSTNPEIKLLQFY